VQFEISIPETKVAMYYMRKRMRSQHESKKAKASDSFPEDILRQMVTCQAAAYEFVRHFWAAVSPPKPGDISAAAMATPAQKAAKAQRMLSYLEKTGERVDTVVQKAAQQKVDATRVKQVGRPFDGNAFN
jgi:transcription initiation factor TFIIH subunit 1